MEIIEALGKLDPANDEHWTQDGHPAVAAVNEILGDTVTRADIDQVAPDFARPQEPPAPPKAMDADSKPQPDNDAGGELDHREDEGQAVAGFPRLRGPKDKRARIAWMEGLMADIGESVRTGKKALDALNREYQDLVKEAPGPTPQEEFQRDQAHYNKTQGMLRAERAERLKMLRESNIDVKELGKLMHPSQLDSAMSRKNTRGAQRPEFFDKSSPKPDAKT